MKKRLFSLVCLLLGVAAGALAQYWTMNPHAFQYDMTAYISLKDMSTIQQYADYELAAFCEEECRGVGKVLTASDGTSLFQLRIRSNNANGETITFRIYQQSTECEYLLNESIPFVSQSVVGTPSTPFVVNAMFTPVTITAKSYTREYGDANPLFEYTSEGATIDGMPEITCEATATSPAGEYPIIIRKGSVTNFNDSYVNGVLTITKAPLMIKASTYTKKQYDPMPEFSVSYDGFKNEETTAVLTKQVVISCDANADSAPGEYYITLSSAEATNYDIVYVAGKLTVNEPDSYTLTYMVDGEVYQSFSIKYRDVITPLDVLEKEGYTFSGWSEIPASMPANDVIVTGTFKVNKYLLTYQVDGEVFKSDSIVFGSPIVPLEEPTREGYVFSKWSVIPEIMPAHDVVITGSFTKGAYVLTYYVDGEAYKIISYDYEDSITPEAELTKEGYTFSGWSEIPATMPANDVIVTGTFTINKYLLTYKVDGEIVKSDSIVFNAAITPEAEPTKKGYTFSGWSEIPATMPAQDVIITGTFKVNKYLLTYKVDDEIVKSDSIVFNAEITPEAEPTKEGYTFSGWSEIPATMPAQDVIITGTFKVNKYLLTYKVDDEIVKSDSIVFNTAITPEANPTKEGYTFSGWSEIPETMPANDVIVTGTFKINKYLLTYKVDDEIVKSDSIVYNTAITPEAEPMKEGYTFSGWSEIPDSMPAHDVEVTGSFTINKYKLTYMIDDKVYKDTVYEYSATIVPEPMPAGNYVTFEWIDLPDTMPAHDVVVHASYTTGIREMILSKPQDVQIYSPNGKKLNKLQKGLNIVVMSNGKTQKVVVK